MRKIKYIFILIIIINLNIFSFADELSNYREVDYSKINEKIEKIEVDIENLKNDNVNEKVQDNRIDNIEKFTDGFSFWAIPGILIAIILLGIYTYTIAKSAVEKVVSKKRSELDAITFELSHEREIKKKTKLLVISKENNELGKILRKMFLKENIIEKNIDENNYIIENILANDICSKIDVIVFNNNIKNPEQITEEIENKLVSIVDKRDIIYFYYHTDKRRLQLKQLDIEHNIANSKVNIYANLMDLLKYKKDVLSIRD